MSILPASGVGEVSTGFYNDVATQSLRTEYGDSNYFYYTPSAGDRMNGSFSIWLKGQNLSDTAYGRYFFQNYGGGSESQFSFIQINNTGNMAFGGYGVNYFASNAVLRDESNYYNLLWTWDTTNGTQNKRQRGYINGVELTSMGSGTRSGVRQELGYGGNFQHNFLANYYPPGGGSDSYVTGYSSYACYVNGFALDPTAFGETKDGVWIPKNYETKPSLIAQGTGTAIGDLTGQGGLAGAFNGTRFQAYASGAATTGSQATGYIGKNWGSSKTITGFILYSPTNFGFVGSGGSTFTVKLYGKNGAPSSATDGTLLFTSSSVNDNLISTNGERGAIKYFADTTITSEETISSFTTTAFTYHWVVITPNTSESVHVGQIEFYEDGNTHFGTGGFRLDFNASDLNTTGSSRTDPYGSGTDQPNNTIADASGSGNHLTKTTNILSTDFVLDSPENSFCVLNAGGKQSASALSEGNLKAIITSGSNSGRTPATFAVNSGKWYWEVRQSSSNRFAMGVFDTEKYIMANEDGGVDQYEWVLVTNDNSGAAQLVNNSNYTSGYGGTVADGHVVMVALDVDNGAIWFGKQGSWFNKGTSDNSATVKAQIEAGTTTNAAFTGVTGRLTPSFVRQTSNNTLNVNFGSDDTFAGNETTAGNTDSNGIGKFQYEPPSGFLALSSQNLPDLTISPAQDTQADDHFNTFLYTGDGTSDRNIALNTFTPDWSWNKGRSQVTQHTLIDSSRRNGDNFPNLHTNTTDAEANDTHPKIVTNGIQVSGGLDNNNGTTFVVWTWKCGGSTPAKTYKVVVVSDGGNKYRFRNSADNATFAQSAVTLDLQELGTYTFDLSDSSVDGHPMKFSTTSNGSHGGGSTYSTGVVYKLDGVTKTESDYVSEFNSATTRQIIITVASSAPTLYYWCHYHSGMGGQINTNTSFGSTNFDGSLLCVTQTNETSGFSIITYTGTGSLATLGHGLNVAPSMVILKNRTGGSVPNWVIGQDQSGFTGQLYFDGNAFSSNSGSFNNTAPTSSVVTINTDSTVNQSTKTYVMYCFANVEGYSAVGSYTGNGSTDGPYAYLGFRPAFIMLKRSNDSGGWQMLDNKRNTFNAVDRYLSANGNHVEIDGSTLSPSINVDFLSQGFKIRSTEAVYNSSGGTFLYLAFAEQPFKFSNAR